MTTVRKLTKAVIPPASDVIVKKEDALKLLN